MARYLIALGSNQRHTQFGAPRRIIAAALRALDNSPLKTIAASHIIRSRPIGPSQREYANAAALIETELSPDDLFRTMQNIERDFGRKRSGQRWRARTLDLDIILWSGGNYVAPNLRIPHAAYRERRFVLKPLCQLAHDWRDPECNLRIIHLHARLDHRRRCD